MSMERDKPPPEEYSVGDDTLVDQERPARRGHSPGPWRIVDNNNWLIYDRDGKAVFQLEDDGSPIFHSYNARLIAAAPELLEIVRHFADVIPSLETSTVAERHDLKRARALIRRIEGPTPKEGG
jgi:hypothetical protein